MFEAIARSMAQGAFRDLAIVLAGLLVLAPVAWLLHGRKRLARELTDERIAAVGILVLLALWLGFALYNRYMRG